MTAMGDGNIIDVLARIYVDDLDAALPLYERLTGEASHLFRYGAMRLARTGVFLLVEHATPEARAHSATVNVRDITQVVDAVTAAGGELMEGPAAGPNGERLIARHPDGNIVEYVEIVPPEGRP
jgi:predicted enzyme related to lactoylglutathione lyase